VPLESSPGVRMDQVYGLTIDVTTGHDRLVFLEWQSQKVLSFDDPVLTLFTGSATPESPDENWYLALDNDDGEGL